jgi:restriction system-associated AAA family ATPase
MKLKRLQLIDSGEKETSRFKSLEPFNQEFVKPADSEYINTICLVGVNGSGKSNLLELIAEIFFYLESAFLKYFPKNVTSRFKIQFEIEYILTTDNDEKIVKITKHKNKKVEYSLWDKGGEFVKVEDPKIQVSLLPRKIIGYSSGLNETLSVPFKLSRGYYSDEVGIQANPKSTSKIQPKDVYPPRLMYLDNEINSFIIISNFLFKSKEDLKVFSDLLRINSLHSFRIIIQFNHTAAPKGGILRTPELEEYVNQLVKCSTTSCYLKDTDSWVLDFLNGTETRKAFEFYFKSAIGLFTALYKLSLLNPLCVKGRENRKWAISNDIFPPDKAFRIEQLKLIIDNPTDVIDYSGISDGEHQFIHVVGSAMLFDEKGILYLLDEPETHYNPKWRAEFITSINGAVKNHPQEFVITTHSPFLLSDTRGFNVFVFRRDGDRVWFEPIGFETFGSSFQVLLKQAFSRDVLISEMALEEIKAIEKETDLSELINRTATLGDSYEKQFLVEKINKLILEKKQK